VSLLSQRKRQRVERGAWLVRLVSWIRGAIACDGRGRGEHHKDAFGVHGCKLGVRRARWDGIEPSLYVSISSQELGGSSRFVGIDGHGVALSAVRRRTFQAQLSLLRSPPARPRGGRAARARGTRGSVRRTLGGAAGASGSHPVLLRVRCGGLGGDGANKNSRVDRRRRHRSRRPVPGPCGSDAPDRVGGADGRGRPRRRARLATLIATFGSDARAVAYSDLSGPGGHPGPKSSQWAEPPGVNADLTRASQKRNTCSRRRLRP
jgi:hypothetical protein